MSEMYFHGSPYHEGKGAVDTCSYWRLLVDREECRVLTHFDSYSRLVGIGQGHGKCLRIDRGRLKKHLTRDPTDSWAPNEGQTKEKERNLSDVIKVSFNPKKEWYIVSQMIKET